MPIRNPSYKTTIEQQVIETTITEEFNPTSLTLTNSAIADSDEIIIIKSGVAKRMKASKIKAYTGTGGGGAPTGIIFLSHFDSENDSTQFTDEQANIITNHGAVYASTTGAKFGASANFTTDGDYLSTSGSGFTFGGDWTIEAWIYLNNAFSTNNKYAYFFSLEHEDKGITVFHYRSGAAPYNNKWAALIGDMDTENSILTASAPTLDAWHHVAITSTLDTENNTRTNRFWLDGQSIGSNVNPLTFASNPTLYIGRSPYNLATYNAGNLIIDFRGKIDEVRISNNEALYTANFSPPTAPFEL